VVLVTQLVVIRMKKKQEYDRLLKEVITIAKKIVSEEIDPNEGCSKIGEITETLDWPDELIGFWQLAHEQYGHEHLGMTAENTIPEIIKEAKELIDKYTE